MNQEERQILIALISVPLINRGTIKRLRKAIGEYQITWNGLWSGRSQVWNRCGLKEEQQVELRKFQGKCTPASYSEFLFSKNIDVLTDLDESYPPLLKQIHDAPMVLFIKGPTEKLSQLPIPVVGTRHPTIY